MTTGTKGVDAVGWFEGLKKEILADSPYMRSEYFKRFAEGRLSREQAWGHLAQNYLQLLWFPRIFSGIHSRCDSLEVRQVCTRHLLVEDLGYFRGKLGGTPDHVELYKWIGDDLGYGREVWDRITPLPETEGILAFYRKMAYDLPWAAALCTTALLEEEVIEVAKSVGAALVKHYGCRPEHGGQNYSVHAEVEAEESGDTEHAIVKYLTTPEDFRVTEQAMRELHSVLVAYAKGLHREYVEKWPAGR